LNQDYQAITAAYNAQKQFKEAARGSVKMACVLCHKNKVTRAFLPCEHAAVCDACCEKNDIGPMRPNIATGKAPGRGKVSSGHIMWDMCPVCLGNVLAIVPCGTTQDPTIRRRVEDMLVSVAGGQGAAEAVPQRFKTLFARAARLLRDWAEAKQSGRGVPPGPPTKSAIAASGWEGGWENSSDEENGEKGASGSGGGGEILNLWKPEIVSPKWKK
jgi:hypothetical protein